MKFTTKNTLITETLRRRNIRKTYSVKNPIFVLAVLLKENDDEYHHIFFIC